MGINHTVVFLLGRQEDHIMDSVCTVAGIRLLGSNTAVMGQPQGQTTWVRGEAWKDMSTSV